MNIESEIKEALRCGDATSEIQKNNKKYVLSVKSGSSLIPILDQLFNSGQLSQVPNAQMRGEDAIPSINIDGYLISPSVFKSEKLVKDNRHIYNFDYIAPKRTS